jgi:hypothetical protein
MLKTECLRTVQLFEDLKTYFTNKYSTYNKNLKCKY